MGWAEYILAAIAFLITHSIPLRPKVRRPVEAAVGMRVFLLGYSVLSLAALGWLISAAGRAPFLELWAWAPWQMRVPQWVMAMVCLIVGLSLGKPNPFSFGGTQMQRFDATRPGLVRWNRHPLLLAMSLWAAAHVVPNCDLAHVTMFGAFAGFAVLGMAMIDRRRKREMGPRWFALMAEIRAVPVWQAVPFAPDLAVRTLLAAIGYGVLAWAHPILIGVAPFV